MTSDVPGSIERIRKVGMGIFYSCRSSENSPPSDDNEQKNANLHGAENVGEPHSGSVVGDDDCEQSAKYRIGGHGNILMQAIPYAATAMPLISHGCVADGAGMPREYRTYSPQTRALEDAKPRMIVITAKETGKRNFGLLNPCSR